MRDKIADGAIEVTYAAFDDQLANLFTKSMTALRHLSLWSSHELSLRGDIKDDKKYMDLDQKNSLGQDEKNYEHIIKSKQIAQPNYKYILETENIFDCSIPSK